MALDLAALTARVKARVEADSAAKVAKKVASKDPAKAAEALALQNLADWNTVALVLRHDSWRCSCGASGIAPGGLFLAQEHSRMANCSRLAATEMSPDVEHLPRRQQTVERAVTHCFFCATSGGFTRQHAPRVVAMPAALAMPFIWQAGQAGRVHLDPTMPEATGPRADQTNEA